MRPVDYMNLTHRSAAAILTAVWLLSLAICVPMLLDVDMQLCWRNNSAWLEVSLWVSKPFTRLQSTASASRDPRGASFCVQGRVRETLPLPEGGKNREEGRPIPEFTQPLGDEFELLSTGDSD